MSAIFISHSSKDNEFCEKLINWLSELGHRSVFLDFDEASGIAAGYNWEQKLYQELRLCRAVIVVCSEHLMNSKWCFAEITQARSLGKHIFPIKVKECQIDSILLDSQVVDFLKLGNEKGFEWLHRGLEVAGIDAEDPYDWDGSRPPYPGLLAFQEADAAIFFGRDAEIGEGLDVLNTKHRYRDIGLVMTLGASGSGKSSLIRAGILPILKRDPERWLVVDPFQPGEHPFMALSRVLSAAYDAYTKKKRSAGSLYNLFTNQVDVPQNQPENIEPESGEAPPADGMPDTVLEELHSAIQSLESLLQNNSIASEHAARTFLLSGLRKLQTWRTALATGKQMEDTEAFPGLDTEWLSGLLEASGREQASILIVIDQFEELLGRPTGHPGTLFLKFLRQLLDAGNNKLIVLGTMRSDFLGAFQQHPVLQGLDFGRILVGSLESAALTDIIEKPATLAGIRIEPKLLRALIEDAGTDDALPLLAFTLRELYDKFSDDGLLEYREYRDLLGGLQGALAKAAENVLSNPPLDAQQEMLLRKAFLFMARVNEEGNYTREVARREDMPDAVQGILKRLVDGRLLVSRGGENGEETLEVAHETIFKSWKRLRDWLDEDREFLLWRRRLHSAVEEWQYKEKDNSTLLTGAILSEASNWFDRYESQLDREEREIIQLSIAHAKKLHARRNALVLGSMTFLVLVGIGMFLLFLNAREQKQQADENLKVATEREMQAAGIAITTLDERKLRDEYSSATEGVIRSLENASDSAGLYKQLQSEIAAELSIASNKTTSQIALFDRGIPLQLGKVDEALWAAIDTATFFKEIHNVGILTRIKEFNSDGRWFPLEKIEGEGVGKFQDFLIRQGFLVKPRIRGVFGYRTNAAARLWYEYMRTEEGGGRISVGVPDGAFGLTTRYHMLRHEMDTLPPAWAGHSLDNPTDEYLLWLQRLERIKGELLGKPPLSIQMVESFKDSSATLKLSEWDFSKDHVHIIGIRRNVDAQDDRTAADDVYVLLINGLVYKFYGSTDPNPGMASRPDPAFLANGQHIYDKSWHKIESREKTYQALKPKLGTPGVLTFRSIDGINGLSEVDIQAGVHANTTINMHWSGVGSTNWSVGAQVIAGGAYINAYDKVIDYRRRTALSYSDLGSYRDKEFQHKGAYSVFTDLIWASSTNEEVRYTLLDESFFKAAEGQEISELLERLTAGD